MSKSVLNVWLGEILVGQLHSLPGDKSLFIFDDNYMDDTNRPVLSQSFYQTNGQLIKETAITQTQLPAFFSNLLPEGHLRKYLAQCAGVKPVRELQLLAYLGSDLPGAVVVNTADEMAMTTAQQSENIQANNEQRYRFSLAGVQLKFSAIVESSGGLTIPTSGVGGDWIVKLPAQNFPQVPENEWSMLHLAKQVGITVPEARLLDVKKVTGLPDLGVLASSQALAIRRFDRGTNGQRIHIEDFAQVYQQFPQDKYHHVSYANMTQMVWLLLGESGLVDFIQRLVFSLLIGNGDMHLKNWSLIYPDKYTPQLAPAYDYVSTIPYLPNDRLALTLAGTKNMQDITLKQFKKLAIKANIPQHMVIQTVQHTVANIQQHWQQHKKHYPLQRDIIARIDKHMLQLSTYY